MRNLQDIASQILLRIGRELVKAEPISGGLIHSSFYLLDNHDDSYVLQAINTQIFKNPELVQQNIRSLNQFLSSQNFPYKTASFLKIDENRDFLQSDGRVWRLGAFYKDTACYSQIPDADHLQSAVQALADFHKVMSLPGAPELTSPIPGFLDFESRRKSFQLSLAHGIPERIKKSKSLVGEMLAHVSLTDRFAELASTLGSSVIHGDPKLSNFLFDAHSAKVEAIIDLDTVQSGSVLYDIGDLIRSAASMYPEDEDLGKHEKGQELVHVENLNLILDSYLDRVNDPSKMIGRSELLEAAAAVVFVQAMRFLSDYLTGDLYYHIQYPEQNLVRAENQLRLAKALRARNGFA